MSLFIDLILLIKQNFEHMHYYRSLGQENSNAETCKNSCPNTGLEYIIHISNSFTFFSIVHLLFILFFYETLYSAFSVLYKYKVYISPKV